MDVYVQQVCKVFMRVFVSFMSFEGGYILPYYGASFVTKTTANDVDGGFIVVVFVYSCLEMK